MGRPDPLQLVVQQEVQRLTQSVSSLIENFHRFKAPLMESHDKVPHATNQLDKIAEQTEAAAHSMLDTIERISQRQEQLITGLNQIAALAVNGETDTVVMLARTLADRAADTLNDSYALVNALQFQDITAQQMNHAGSMLEEIEAKLQHLLQLIGCNKPPTPSKITGSQRARAFDPHADMYEGRAKQADIDSLFHKPKQP